MIVLKIIGWVLLGILALIVLVLCVRIRIAVEYSDDNTNVLLQWLFLKIPLYPQPPKAPKEPKPQKEKKKKKGAEAEETPPEPAPETPAAGQEAQTETPPEPAQEGTAPSEAPQAETAAQESAPGTPSEGGGTEKPAEKKESLLHIIYRTHGVDGILEILRRVFSYLGSFFGDMMKALVIEELYLDIGCAKKDAAETAIHYGEVCAALYPMLGALASKCKIKKYDINVYPDYLARFGRASFFVKFHVYPIYLTGVTVVLVCRMLFKVLLRMLVKILLPKKDKNAEGKNKKTEKEDESNEGPVSSRNPVHND